MIHELNTAQMTAETAKDILCSSPSFNWQRRAYLWLYGANLIDRTTVWTAKETPKAGDTGLLASKVLYWTGEIWVNYKNI